MAVAATSPISMLTRSLRRSKPSHQPVATRNRSFSTQRCKTPPSISSSKESKKMACSRYPTSSRERSHALLSRSWTHQLCKMTTTWTWSTGRPRTHWPSASAHACTSGPPRPQRSLNSTIWVRRPRWRAYRGQIMGRSWPWAPRTASFKLGMRFDRKWSRATWDTRGVLGASRGIVPCWVRGHATKAFCTETSEWRTTTLRSSRGTSRKYAGSSGVLTSSSWPQAATTTSYWFGIARTRASRWPNSVSTRQPSRPSRGRRTSMAWCAAVEAPPTDVYGSGTRWRASRFTGSTLAAKSATWPTPRMSTSLLARMATRRTR